MNTSIGRTLRILASDEKTQLFDSVAPAVKYISFGCTPRNRATAMRASSSAFAAFRPCWCVSDAGLPNAPAAAANANANPQGGGGRGAGGGGAGGAQQPLPRDAHEAIFQTPLGLNAALFGLERSILANRLLWIGVALAILAFTHVRFRLDHRGA